MRENVSFRVECALQVLKFDMANGVDFDLAMARIARSRRLSPEDQYWFFQLASMLLRSHDSRAA